MNYTEYALIVAGGKGTRVGASVPKQFLPLNGLPVLMHTILAFERYAADMPIVVVLPQDDVAVWNALCGRHRFDRPVTIVHGGTTRSQSVRNGLVAVDGPGYVAIHDGVRPLVTPSIIAESFRQAAAHQAAVAAVALKESIRYTKDGEQSSAVDRSAYRLVQTPQTFDIDLIKQSYDKLQHQASLTDDAGVVEAAGHAVSLFEGSYENLKITTSEDLAMAEALLQKRSDVTFNRP